MYSSIRPATTVTGSVTWLFVLLLAVAEIVFNPRVAIPLRGSLIPHLDGHIQLEDEVTVEREYMVLKPHSVLLTVFETKLQTAKTYHDVIRIFFNYPLTDEVIDEIMMSHRNLTSPVSVQQPAAAAAMTMPRLGGVRDDIAWDDDGYFRGMNLAMKHIKEMTPLTSCQPVPTVINVFDEIPNEDRLANMEYYPKCTVLNRCSSKLCCKRGTECMPLNITTVTKYFMMLQLKGEEYLSLPPIGPQYKEFQFENHTACACRPVNSIASCRKCPDMFLMRKNGTDCVCTCAEDNKTCLQIQKGRKSISQEDLECIKAGNCTHPTCLFGGFELAKGYCPMERVASSTLYEVFSSGADKLFDVE